MKHKVIAHWLAGALLSSACATYRPPPKPGYQAEHQPTFESFRGEPVAVDVVDKGALFTSAPDVLTAAQQSITGQLRAHGVTVDDTSRRRFVFELSQSQRPSDDRALVSCVRVAGSIQNTAQQFMPTREFVSTRCRDRSGGPGVGASGGGSNSVIGAAIYAALITVPSLISASTSADQTLAGPLSEGLSDVLSQLDAQAQAGP